MPSGMWRMMGGKGSAKKLPKGLDAMWEAGTGQVQRLVPRRQNFLRRAQRVVELAPDFAPVRWRLGLWQLEGGHLEQAQAMLRFA